MEVFRCSGCRKDKVIESGKTCNDCKNRQTKRREKEKEEVIKCIYKNGDKICNFKKSDDNEYCGKHQTQFFKDSVESQGKKVCANYVRGCRQVLDQEYKFKKCQDCLEKDRIKERKILERKESDFKNNTDNNKKFCGSCGNHYEKDRFIKDDGDEAKTCYNCRLSNKKADAKRKK